MQGQKIKCLLHLIVFIIFSSTSVSIANKKRINIATVFDGEWKRHTEIFLLFKKEIIDILKDDFDVSFPSEKIINCGWDKNKINEVTDKLLADDDVDIILSLGVVTTSVFAQKNKLTKPVFAPLIMDVRWQQLPFKNGTSGKKNFYYINFNKEIIDDVKIFQRLTDFKRLDIIVSKSFLDILPQIKDYCAEITKEICVDVKVIGVPDNAISALENIPSDCTAVYLGPLFSLSEDEFKKMIDGLNKRMIPTYSIMGKPDVEDGVFAGNSPEVDYSRWARRLAVNIQRTCFGEAPSSFNVFMNTGSRLVINMKTARMIKKYPSWDMMTDAILLNREEKEGITRWLSLSKVIDEAIKQNREIIAKIHSVNAGEEDRKIAQSYLLPQVDLSLTGLKIDKDRARASFGLQPENSLTGSIKLSQVLFSEPLEANLKIQKYLQLSREKELDRIKLDIMYEASVIYLNLLKAKTFERIQYDNLEITRTNLELARLRKDIGVSTPSEVYRWESTIAQNRLDLLKARSELARAKIFINRILHRPLEEKFITREVDLFDPILLTSQSKILNYVKNPWYFKVFRDFMVEEGLKNSPELEQLDKLLLAKKREIESNKASFWAPTVVFQGQIDKTISKSGEGSKTDELFSGLFPEKNNTDWSAGINVSFPLFTGGKKDASLNKTIEEYNNLLETRNNLKEKLEQRIRDALEKAATSYSGIELSRSSAEAAHKNLELVRDAYSRGTVNIIDLLDAQNQSLVADQLAAVAVYDFIIDLLEVQRSTGKVIFFTDNENKEKWLNKLDTYYKQQGIIIKK